MPEGFIELMPVAELPESKVTAPAAPASCIAMAIACSLSRTSARTWGLRCIGGRSTGRHLRRWRPAHGSMFDLATGKVRRGSALTPVTAYEAKVEGEKVVVRPA